MQPPITVHLWRRNSLWLAAAWNRLPLGRMRKLRSWRNCSFSAFKHEFLSELNWRAPVEVSTQRSYEASFILWGGQYWVSPLNGDDYKDRNENHCSPLHHACHVATCLGGSGPAVSEIPRI